MVFFSKQLNRNYYIWHNIVKERIILLNDKNDFENKKNTNGNIEYTVNQERVMIYGE